MAKKDTFEVTRTGLDLIMRRLNRPIHGEQARMRSRFIKIVNGEYEKMFPARQAILEKYANKDEAGKAKLSSGPEGSKLYDIPEASQEACKKEMSEFTEGKVSFPVDKESRPVYVTITKILKEDMSPMGIADGEVYDEVLTELESI